MPSSVDDMFDLAAPSLQAPRVARLVPLRPHLEAVDVHQDDGHLDLGRSKDLRPPCRIDGAARLSSKHCTLTIDAVTLRVTVTDTSTNGTFLNSQRIPKGEAVVLRGGDKLSLTKPVAEGSDAEADTEAVEFIFQRLKAETSLTTLVDELTCGICRGVYLRPVTLVPCMHVLCASCVSQWLQQGKTTCPECRVQIDEVRPTHKIQSCVEQLLASQPSLRRTAEEVRALEALDIIPPAGKVLRKRPRAGEGVNDDGEEMSVSGASDEARILDSDIEPSGVLRHPQFVFASQPGHAPPRGPCPQCAAPSAVDGFQCVPGGLHLICGGCRRLFPERPQCSRPQRCHLCSTPYCSLYLASEGGCQGSSSNFKPLQEHTFSAVPPMTFAGNTTEQSILTTYLANRQLLMDDVWRVCLGKLREGLWQPDLSCVNGAVTPTSAVCERCAAAIFGALLFHFRRAIPRDDLPESVTNRSNCWYGVNCRTQFHRPQHAQTYNHVCYQEKRKE